ncbi:CDP-alcohol phosphatidyltransferase family protein [Campylobacter sp. IFREMER_LSEM_CL1904]|uniref:CDP-alcohol phosphatidyltransferase family protein n=1 Tax=unclassified Campylobacter TaxID=2593542 RepID=UPI0021E63706|nr:MULTISPECIES: CDP-alcohol phosphatidyltransferase family protein [unclassified Campylobacter]MCV3428666.1 CDP-alcohol phosphatidyltransferase family protein [Campylobacter sp. IFREMER_LSEM_CL1904]MCV3480256.1 CDP-alcohol phosphatidyltransferase family protein [Campylobacter sp. CNRCH_2015_1657]
MDRIKIKKHHRLEDKSMYIIEYVYRIIIISRILPFLAKKNIHPILVTFLNTLLFPFILYCLYHNHFILGALLVQCYALIDHTDGMLARYTNKKTYIGSRLDRINDNIFFNMIFIVLTFSTHISIYFMILVLLSMNIHNFFGMFYFAKKLRKLKKIQRFGVKKWLLDRNFLLGMDCSMMLFLVSLFLLFGKIKAMFCVIASLYIFDLIYRLIELKINEKLEKKV